MRGYLPDQTRLSEVHLGTARPQQALDFYSGLLGLTARRGETGQILLATGPDRPLLLRLTEVRAGAARAASAFGLAHVAIRFPTESDVARVSRRLLAAGHSLTPAHSQDSGELDLLMRRAEPSQPVGDDVRSRFSFSHHDLLAASPTAPAPGGPVYVRDPDGHTIELCAGVSDRGQSAAAADLILDHLHFYVSDLVVAERFYADYLGFALSPCSDPKTRWFGVSGCPQQIGVSVSASPLAANAGGTISYRLEVPLTEILYCLSHRAPLLGYETKREKEASLQIRDPSGCWLEIVGPRDVPGCSGQHQDLRPKPANELVGQAPIERAGHHPF